LRKIEGCHLWVKLLPAAGPLLKRSEAALTLGGFDVLGLAFASIVISAKKVQRYIGFVAHNPPVKGVASTR
jgi:hypothetical protein